MSITSIKSYLFDTLITLQRRHIHLDSIGGIDETWITVGTNVPSSLQNMTISEQRIYNQGKTYNVLKKAYIPIKLKSSPRNGDKVIDNKTGKNFDVIGVEKYQASRNNIGAGHHYKLFLLELDLTIPTS